MGRSLLLAALLGSVAFAREPEMIPAVEPDVLGRTAPDVEAPLLGGGTFRLAAHRGTPVVVSFFASWCTPCRRELPALADLARARADVHVVAVNVDREPSAALRFLRALGPAVADLPVALDDKAAALGAFRVVSMPTLFLVDGHGTVAFRREGFSQEKGLSELEAAIEGLRR